MSEQTSTRTNGRPNEPGNETVQHENNGTEDARHKTAGNDAPHQKFAMADETGGTVRRTFLRSAAVVGSVALLGSTTVAARQENCQSFATTTVGGGQFQLVNNDWGSSDVDMCIWTEDNGDYGYEWSTRTSGGPPNYPQALLGTKPWGSDTGVRDFPIQRGDVDQLELEVDIDQSISGGEWDLAEEWWLMDAPVSEQSETHTHEIMLVLDWGGGHSHGGTKEESVWTDKFGNTIDYWVHYGGGGGTSADFHIFRVQGGLTSGRVDLKPVIDFMSERHGVGGQKWISGIELGNEYWQGSQGDVTFHQFDVTINGTTYSSGSGGGSGNSGSGGDSDDGTGGDSGDDGDNGSDSGDGTGSDDGSGGDDGTGSDDGSGGDDGTGGNNGSGGNDGTDGGSSDPIATLSPSTTSASVDERITFHVQDTSGVGRWITDLEWDFGDGTTATGWWNAHRYDAPGTYTVELLTTANNGDQTMYEVTITVS
ncbi:PKD domain-containing protein [Natrinema halophilum]|nr:PKD domain-containing protein [Natrinema halophilum]UHQ95993.1 PKD domain-containing protein [Natrinema halophilum]